MKLADQHQPSMRTGSDWPYYWCFLALIDSRRNKTKPLDRSVNPRVFLDIAGLLAFRRLDVDTVPISLNDSVFRFFIMVIEVVRFEK